MSKLNMYRLCRRLAVSNAKKIQGIVLRAIVNNTYYYIYREDCTFIKNYLNKIIQQM